MRQRQAHRHTDGEKEREREVCERDRDRARNRERKIEKVGREVGRAQIMQTTQIAPRSEKERVYG